MTCPLCVEKDTDYDLLQAKLKASLREAQMWKNRFNAVEAKDPATAEIKSLLEHWHQAVGRNGQTKLPLDGDRAKRVRWALKHYDHDEIRRVIDKLAAYPYVWKDDRTSRRMPYGTREQRSDDITAALYSEKTIEKFLALGEKPEPDERLVQVPARVIDEMKFRVEQANYWMGVWQEAAHDNDELVLSLAAQVEAARSGRHLSVVAA